jgi:NAD(P)-dependent dehydrogenase (short-subunit alcohol dehydrogenase family)
VLITGGSRGIGAATALRAAANGFAGAVNYGSNAGAADAVVALIQAGGGTAIAVPADVSDETQVLAMYRRIDDTLGPVTALVKMVPMQRAGSAQEVANAIVWLLSGQASYVTGSFIDVTGGR